MKIATCIIAYQAEEKIRELLESLKGETDYLVVGIDPKTTDATEKVAQEYGAITVPITDPMLYPEDQPEGWWVDREKPWWEQGKQWGFAQARQQVFDAVPDDTDWYFWIDTDDVLAYDPDKHPGMSLRKLVEDKGQDVSLVWMPYFYHRDKYANPTTIFDRERLIRRSYGPKWIGALHETCQTERRGAHPRDYRMWSEHKNRTESGKNDRNIRILTKMVEDPGDLRAVLYLGHQYFTITDWEKAAHWYNIYLDRSKGQPSVPTEERWQALIYLSKALRSAGDLTGSQNAAVKAYGLCPQYADAYFEMAHNAAQSGAHRRAITWHEDGLKKDRPDQILIQNPLDYTFNPHVVIHPSYFHMGQTQKALECVETALKIRPDDEELGRSKKNYEWALHKKNSFEAAQQLVTFLLDSNEPLKARDLLRSLPAGSWEQDERFRKVREEIDARLVHLKDEVEYENFYYGSGEEPDVVEQIEKKDGQGGRVAWIIDRVLASGARSVLDVGFGNAFIALRLAKMGIRVVGIDCDVGKVKKANFAAVKLGLLESAYNEDYEADLPLIGPFSAVQFHYGRAEKIPQFVKDLGPFDAVILGEVVEHVPDVDAVLAEAESVAHRVILTTPDGGGPYQWQMNRADPDTDHAGHIRSWSRIELEEAFGKRGRVIESHPVHDQDHILAFEYTTEKPSDGPPIDIFCGKALEEWTPDQVNAQGLGGSETAVVELARVFANYTMPSGQRPRVRVNAEVDGVWDGVLYRHHTKFVPSQPRWLFVGWRNAAVFDMPVEADLRWAWVHDVILPNLTPERDAKIDTYLVLSEWHKSNMKEHFPFVEDRKYAVVGNGLDPSRFSGSEERVPSRIVYASSPDRGLDRALAYFPQIKKAIPEATLEVFYGWSNYEKAGQRGDYRKKIERMLQQPGVTFRGRVGQKDLARELMRAGVLLYPSHEFCETYGITFLEAQAAGCVPVTRDNGALPETNRYGFCLPNAEADITNYIEAIKEAMAFADEEREEMRRWALSQTWDLVAEKCLDRAREVYRQREPKPEPQEAAAE